MAKNKNKIIKKKIIKRKKQKKAWVVTVDMGYGHQRAAFPLKEIAVNESVINANRYEGIPEEDEKVWQQSQSFYEAISRAKHLPLVGNLLFSLFDKWQAISPFYPRRNLAAVNFQTRQTYRLIEKGWGEDLIKYLNQDPLPLVTTFFVPAFMAEAHQYKGDIYCVICDADIARNWAPYNPPQSKIKYLVPNVRASDRLKLYGIKPQNIFLTGFPLPKENVGGLRMNVLREDLAARIYNLDPSKRFIKNYHKVLETHLGKGFHLKKAHHPLTLTFAVGGAGAQRELGIIIVKSLKNKIIKNRVRIYLVAGVRNDVYRYFRESIIKLGLERELNRGINIIFQVSKEEYFTKFNETLHETDILWTKPSELSFYTGLGLPIIMAPPIGSQEIFNQKWLMGIGGGMNQDNPKYTNEWLFDWLESGWLAEAALEGFLDGPKFGAYKIEDIISGKKLKPVEEVELL